MLQGCSRGWGCSRGSRDALRALGILQGLEMLQGFWGYSKGARDAPRAPGMFQGLGMIRGLWGSSRAPGMLQGSSRGWGCSGDALGGSGCSEGSGDAPSTPSSVLGGALALGLAPAVHSLIEQQVGTGSQHLVQAGPAHGLVRDPEPLAAAGARSAPEGDKVSRVHVPVVNHHGHQAVQVQRGPAGDTDTSEQTQLLPGAMVWLPGTHRHTPAATIPAWDTHTQR